MQRVLIADMSEAFTMALEKELHKEFLVCTCNDGRDVMRLLSAFRPDVLILNLTLPYKDGFSILRDAEYLPDIILGITGLVNGYVIHTAQALGIRFLMQMPTVRSVRQHLAELLKDPTDPHGQEDRIHAHLQALRIPAHMDGYRYLLVGIRLYAKDPSQRFSKELYPAIAQAADCGDSRSVERCIRSAIAHGWMHRDRTVWETYFPSGENRPDNAPTNKAFIARLAQFLVE